MLVPEETNLLMIPATRLFPNAEHKTIVPNTEMANMAGTGNEQINWLSQIVNSLCNMKIYKELRPNIVISGIFLSGVNNLSAKIAKNATE